MEGPIGGEVPPINANDLISFKNELFGTAKGIDIIERGHYSTMKIGDKERPCQSSPNSQQCVSFMAMHRKMGYNFHSMNGQRNIGIFSSRRIFASKKS